MICLSFSLVGRLIRATDALAHFVGDACTIAVIPDRID